MKITILTLFPEMFSGVLSTSILKREQEKGKVSITSMNIRDFSNDSYKTVDDHPYGGGVGMVMRVDVIDRAIEAARETAPDMNTMVILLDPQGVPHTQKIAHDLANKEHLIFICAHYEGIDERIRGLADMEISLGDFILTGGEIPTMAVIDSIVRLLPGALGKDESTVHESFERPLLEYPQYTRPEEYKGKRVPDVLLSGNHKAIADWREQEALNRTKIRRPDLLSRDGN